MEMAMVTMSIATLVSSHFSSEEISTRNLLALRRKNGGPIDRPRPSRTFRRNFSNNSRELRNYVEGYQEKYKKYNMNTITEDLKPHKSGLI